MSGEHFLNKMDTKTLMGIILLVVGFIAVVSIIAGFSTSIVNAGNAAQYANNCTLRAGYSYNISNGWCLNETYGAAYPATMYNLPLSSLFSPSGILVIVLLIVLFIVLIIWLFKKQ